MRGQRVFLIQTNRLVLNDAATQLGLSIGGYGVAQVFELGIAQLLEDDTLVNLADRALGKGFKPRPTHCRNKPKKGKPNGNSLPLIKINQHGRNDET